MMRRLLFMSVCLAFSAALTGVAVVYFAESKPPPRVFLEETTFDLGERLLGKYDLVLRVRNDTSRTPAEQVSPSRMGRFGF